MDFLKQLTDNVIPCNSKDDREVCIRPCSADALVVSDGCNKILRIDTTKNAHISSYVPVVTPALILKGKNNEAYIDSRRSLVEWNLADSHCAPLAFINKAQQQGYLVLDTKCRKVIIPSGVTLETNGVQNNGPVYLAGEGVLWRLSVSGTSLQLAFSKSEEDELQEWTTAQEWHAQ